jgi:hypothetical protein
MVFCVLDGFEFDSFFNDGDDRKIADPKPSVETFEEFSWIKQLTIRSDTIKMRVLETPAPLLRLERFAHAVLSYSNILDSRCLHRIHRDLPGERSDHSDGLFHGSWPVVGSLCPTHE